MIDVQKQVAYWRKGADEDWQVATELIERGRARHGLFFAHLALEKMLKAHVCRVTEDLAPRTHDLGRLAALAGLSLSKEQRSFLTAFDRFQMESRYPEVLGVPTAEAARAEWAEAGRIIEWLNRLF